MKQLLIEQLSNYKPYNEQEEADKEIIIEMIKRHDDIFLRTNKVAHMTASAWVVNPSKTKVLMAYHNIYNSWAWLGGHADGEEDLLSVALREVKEESGISNVKPISKDIYSVEVLTVNGHEKRGKYVSSHLHLNVTYLIEADDTEKVKVKEDENSAVEWFPIEKVIDKSNEEWFKERIYKKLNDQVKK